MNKLQLEAAPFKKTTEQREWEGIAAIGSKCVSEESPEIIDKNSSLLKTFI